MCNNSDVPNIVVTLRSVIETLPDAEKRVAGYILKHPEKVPFLSIYKLAEAGKTSVASVTRLSQKIGCSNFKEMKIQLARQIDSGVSAVFDGISPGDSDADCIKKVFGGNIQSLQDTLQIVDFNTLYRAAGKIARSDQTVFIGTGSSGYIAGDASLRFTHLGLQTACYVEPIKMLLNCSLLGPKSVLVAVSHSGRTKMTINAVALARKKKTVTISISNYPGSPLAKKTDISLCTAFTENLTRASAVSSRISQISIIDSLHVLTTRRLANRNFIDLANNLVEDEFRD